MICARNLLNTLDAAPDDAGPARTVSAPGQLRRRASTRSAIRGQTKIKLSYRDETDRVTERTVWPVAIAYYETVRLLAAWCELRQDFRHFRTDRVTEAQFTEERYPARRDILRSQWRKAMETERDRWTTAIRSAAE